MTLHIAVMWRPLLLNHKTKSFELSDGENSLSGLKVVFAVNFQIDCDECISISFMARQVAVTFHSSPCCSSVVQLH